MPEQILEFSINQTQRNSQLGIIFSPMHFQPSLSTCPSNFASAHNKFNFLKSLKRRCSYWDHEHSRTFFLHLQSSPKVNVSRLIAMFVIHIFRRRLFNKKLLKRSLLFSSPPNMDRSKFQIKRDKLFFFARGWLLATFANNVTSWNVRPVGMSRWKAPNRDYTAREKATQDSKNLNFLSIIDIYYAELVIEPDGQLHTVLRAVNKIILLI